MTDVLTPEQRSYNMSRIRAKDTKPELTLRRLLRERGIRNYRIRSDLPGRPDIVFPREKVAVFVDGCFWHMCPICYTEPATRKEFWTKKIEGNVQRDGKVNAELRAAGWTVLRIWEHDVRKDPEKTVSRIISALGRD